MLSIPRYLHVFPAGATSPSVPADCRHFQWKTSWFVVWSRRCRVSLQLYMSAQYPAHLLRTPSLSVTSLLSLLSMTAALCYMVLVRSLVCRRTLCCFLLSFLSSWHHIAPLSNYLWLISSSSWPRYAMLVLLIASSYGCPSLFRSRLSSYRSNISFIIKMWIISVPSTVPLQLLPVALL